MQWRTNRVMTATWGGLAMDPALETFGRQLHRRNGAPRLERRHHGVDILWYCGTRDNTLSTNRGEGRARPTWRQAPRLRHNNKIRQCCALDVEITTAHFVQSFCCPQSQRHPHPKVRNPRGRQCFTTQRPRTSQHCASAVDGQTFQKSIHWYLHHRHCTVCTS